MLSIEASLAISSNFPIASLQHLQCIYFSGVYRICLFFFNDSHFCKILGEGIYVETTRFNWKCSPHSFHTTSLMQMLFIYAPNVSPPDVDPFCTCECELYDSECKLIQLVLPIHTFCITDSTNQTKNISRTDFSSYHSLKIWDNNNLHSVYIVSGIISNLEMI